MAYYAGQTISDTIAITDWDENPSTLDASTVLSSLTVTHESGTAITPVIISNYTPQGTYIVNFRSRRDLPGLYTLSAFAAETGWEYAQTYQVLPVEQAGLLPELGAEGVIFSEFRARIADRMQDLLRLTATADGGLNTFEDSLNLTDSLNQYAGTHFVMINALEPNNSGQERRVTASSGTTFSVTLNRNLPGITREGDTAHLFNLSGKGFRPQIYDAMIRTVVDEAYPTFLLEIERSVSAFPTDSRRIAIPAEFAAVHSLYLDDDDVDIDYRRVPPSRREGRYQVGFSVDRASRELVINGDWRDEASGIPYRIGGYARHPVPQSDNDYIVIPERWLNLEVSARLAARRRADQQSSSWAIEWGRLAQEERGSIMTPRKPNTTFLG